jgi:hypothetical protein
VSDGEVISAAQPAVTERAESALDEELVWLCVHRVAALAMLIAERPRLTRGGRPADPPPASV